MTWKRTSTGKWRGVWGKELPTCKQTDNMLIKQSMPFTFTFTLSSLFLTIFCVCSLVFMFVCVWYMHAVYSFSVVNLQAGPCGKQHESLGATNWRRGCGPEGSVS